MYSSFIYHFIYYFGDICNMYVPSNDSFQSRCSFHDTFKVIRVLKVEVNP